MELVPTTLLILVAALLKRGLSDEQQDVQNAFEAAFQGRCGHGSPCEQLCYELHDGMFECDCTEGFNLHRNGYSCLQMNATMETFLDQEEDILYQKDASFSAELDVGGNALGEREQYQDSINTPQEDKKGRRKETKHQGNSRKQHNTREYSDYQENMRNQKVEYQDSRMRQKEEEYQEIVKLNYLESRSQKKEDYQEIRRQQKVEEVEKKVQFVTTLSPNLEQKVPSSSLDRHTTESIRAAESPSGTTPCHLDCGPGGSCVLETLRGQRCQCTLGRGGDHCETEVEVRSPRFTGQGWLAFPALRAAYKHVQLEVEFRPETWDGVLILTGERDDMTGDFMALLLHQGFVELRFDCGSGVGVVRSEETVLLNQWNRLTLYRHRWDAWIQLNSGRHVEGRSKGLFSRITFREPLFVGGAGNTTGLADKLPVEEGLKGCIRHLEVNDHVYNFNLAPLGDSIKGFDVEECSADRCSKVPCQHGGKCLTSGDSSAVCLCPLGYTGDLCETKVDLQVPAFNGSSYLRYPGLGGSALSWLDLQMTLKPGTEDGVILYNGHRSDGVGDFMAVYMNDGHLEFTFDLGTGAATIRSSERVTLGDWHELRLSRTGRLAILEVDDLPATQTMTPGAFTQLSLPQNLYIGGVPNFDMVSPKVRIRTSFVGCIQKVVINNQPLQILAGALGGVNVDNCPHPCVARPCGERGHCVPQLDYFTCSCGPGFDDPQCQQHAAPVLLDDIPVPRFTGDSFLHYSDPDTIRRIVSFRLNINMRFRTSSQAGLMLWSGRRNMTSSSDFLALGLAQGVLHFRFNLGSGEVDIPYNCTGVSDGLWHRVKAIRNEQEGSLVVDNGPVVTKRAPGHLRQLNTNTGLYIGGMDNIKHSSMDKYAGGLVGCISDLILDTDYHVKLVQMSTAGRNIKHCG